MAAHLMSSKFARPKLLACFVLLLLLTLLSAYVLMHSGAASLSSTVFPSPIPVAKATAADGFVDKTVHVTSRGGAEKSKGVNSNRHITDSESYSPGRRNEGKLGEKDWKKVFNYTQIKVTRVNCKALFDNDAWEQGRALELLKRYRRPQLPPEFYLEVTQDCASFRHRRGYVTSLLSREERDFPIAFSILVYKDVEQVERLLRAVYRPHNQYCVHVDDKAQEGLRQALKSIALCLDNVFLTPHSVEVRWGEFSVLQPELSCMRELWKRKRKWKYYINLTGQEFPLKTNAQLVAILQAYGGANDLEATVKRADEWRWADAGMPPHRARPVKGSAHVTLCRGFVDFVLHRQVARDLLTWVKDTHIPDELYFSTLSHNPHLGAPGAYLGEPESDPVRKPFFTRFKSWSSGPFYTPCKGERIRDVCVFGVGDLPLLRSRPELFANKFYWNFQSFAFDCMEELHYNRTRDEYLGLATFNTSLYAHADFAKSHLPCSLD